MSIQLLKKVEISKLTSKLYRLEHKDHIKKILAEHYQLNKNEITENRKKYRKENKELVAKQALDYYLRKGKFVRTKYYQKNKEKLQKIGRENYHKKRVIILKQKKEKRDIKIKKEKKNEIKI